MKRECGGIVGRMLAVTVACAMLLLGLAAKPALALEGDGSEGNPYLVGSETDLSEVLNNKSGNAKLNDNITVASSSGIATTTTVNLDLNGKSISSSVTGANVGVLNISQNGSLTLRDGSTNGAGAITSTQGYGVLVQGGILTMRGGSVSSNAGTGVGVESGSATFNGGTISGPTCAVSGNVTNAAGIGWTNVEGTAGRQAIEQKTSASEVSNSFKKVQFPAYDVTVGAGTAVPSTALQGETITITANDPATGKVFDKWTTSDGVTFAKETDAQTTFTMPAKAVTVTANYKDLYKIDASADPEAGGEVSGADTYASGQKATLTAIPAEGYVFDCWTENETQVTGAKAEYTFTVDRARTLVANFRKVIINTTISDQTYAGKPIAPDIPATDISFDGVDYAVRDTDYTLSYENNVHAGTASVILTFSGNFTGTARKTFTIKQAPLTVTAVSATRPYDGTALTASYTSEGLVEGDSILSAEVTGSQTDVGKTTCEVKDVVITNETYGTTTDDYIITYKSGTLEVTPYTKKVTVKITGHTNTVTYDGNEHEVSGYEAKPDVDFYKASDYEFKGTASVKGTNVGAYSMGLSDKDFSNTSSNFTNVVFEVTDGKLTIEESAKATLSFDLAGGTLNGATGTYTMTASIGSTVKLPQAPTRDGYKFKHWKGSEYAAGASYKVTGDHAFTAVWERITYTITFNSNGGSGTMDKMTVNAGDSATLTANKFTRSGYTFNGWNTARDGKGTAYNDKADVTPTGNLVLYAQWTKNAASSSTTKNSTTNASTNKSSLASTGDATSLGLAALLATGGLGLVFAGKRRR